MSDEKDPKDEPVDNEVEETGCDCSHCPGCGSSEEE